MNDETTLHYREFRLCYNPSEHWSASLNGRLLFNEEHLFAVLQDIDEYWDGKGGKPKQVLTEALLG